VRSCVICQLLIESDEEEFSDSRVESQKISSLRGYRSAEECFVGG